MLFFLTFCLEINNLIPSFLNFNSYATCYVYKLTYFDDFYILSIKGLRATVKGQNHGLCESIQHALNFW
jgi:hypothetical protein